MSYMQYIEQSGRKVKNHVYQLHSNNIQKHAVVGNSDFLSAPVKISHMAVRE